MSKKIGTFLKTAYYVIKDDQTKEIEYSLPNNFQKLILSKMVLSKFIQYQQTSKIRKECGGQLFAQISSKVIEVKVATGPYKSDKSTKYSFIPDKKKQQYDIDKCFNNNLHYIGDWHTHPQAIPKPSQTDIDSMLDYFNKSKHQLNNLVLIIVGNNQTEEMLWVGIINNTRVLQLNNL